MNPFHARAKVLLLLFFGAVGLCSGEIGAGRPQPELDNVEVPRYKGLYTHGLTDACETVPVTVDHNGGYLSHNVTKFHSQWKDIWRVNVTIFEENHHLILKPSTNFLAPNMVIERRKRNHYTRVAPKLATKNCHFHGVVHGQPNSRVALSACNGLIGLIHTKSGRFFLEPVHHPDKTILPGHKHLVYKRSAVFSKHQQQRNVNKKRKRRKRRKQHQCGTRDPKRYTEIEWQKQLGKVQVQEKKHKYKNKIQVQNMKRSQLRKTKYKTVNKTKRNKRNHAEDISKKNISRNNKPNSKRNKKSSNFNIYDYDYEDQNEIEITTNFKKDNLQKTTRKTKRSVSQPHFVEALVVADSDMVEFHQDGDIETYILTLMNMVSSYYQDPSIGNYVNVVIVRIILIDESTAEPDFKVTTNADTTLRNFCKWQRSLNPENDTHPHHHDVAILLTRKDICAKKDVPCGTLGVAHIGGMCKQSRSCSVNEDNGITCAHTIAHEMGHNFGMLHDTDKKLGCQGREGDLLHIMAENFEPDAVSVTWSNCSRRYITNFLELNEDFQNQTGSSSSTSSSTKRRRVVGHLKTYHNYSKGLGKCLEDQPEPEEEYFYPPLPPGALYNADRQCRFQFNTTDATVCSLDEICSRMWCMVNESCSTMVRPAAPGTHCGHHKWCQDQKCVPIMEKPVAIDGGWGEWSQWSDCSRTCGSGVSIMQRECDHPTPSGGGKFCVGERKRYRICNSDPCPEGQPTYRALQCSWNNNKTYDGKKYEWQPYFDRSEPCQLYCTDLNETLIVPWGDYAADGTPCNIVSRDVCISGICKVPPCISETEQFWTKKVGCDWVVESTAKEDDCGICQGDGTKCDIVQGEYKKQSQMPGYREIVVIPSGARNIIIEERAPSENYIGIEKAFGRKPKHYLNGKRHFTLPGEYIVGGTQALYERDMAQLEKIFIPGPINESIIVTVFFRGQVFNPGVIYKYSIWKPETTKHVKYSWILEDWSQCSATCGGGNQYRRPICQEQTVSPVASELDPSRTVDEENCEESERPLQATRTCNEDPCPYKWWVGPWQSCPVTCSSGKKHPMHRRNVMCVDDQDVVISDQFCDKKVKPIEFEKCKHILPCEAFP